MSEFLEKKYDDGNISLDEINKYKKSIWIKNSIFLAIYLFMVIYSFIRIKRSTIFFGILGGGKIVSFYSFTLVLFYISLYIIFIYYVFLMGYMVYSEIKKTEWLKTVHSYMVKLDLTSFVFKCLSILLFIIIYITTPCTVVGESMSPTFENGDKIMCSGIYTLKQEDIVIIDALNYTHDASFYIKRIKGVPGMKVEYHEDTALTTVDGEEMSFISKVGFEKMRDSVEESESLSFVIPEGYYMIIGDNYGNSYDSRKFGLIKKEDIFGKVYLRILPMNAMKFY